jgi:hypothetical protein
MNKFSFLHSDQDSAEKESRKIYFFEKSYNFHGKLDFLSLSKSKMYLINEYSEILIQRRKAY